MITSLLEEKFKESNFRDCFLVDLEMKSDKKLSVFIDSEKGITFEECRSISRYLEERIEESGEMSRNYTLEVSSPGADRPLVFLKQYPKHIGRNMVVKTELGSHEGKLLEVGSDFIVIEEGVRNKKVDSLKKVKIDFKSITSAKVLITF